MLQNKESYEIALKSTFNVICDKDLDMAAEVLHKIKSIKEMINNSFESIIKKAHQAHREAIKQRDEYLTPINNVEKTMKQNISIFLSEKHRKEEEEQREKLELIRKEEEEQRKRAEDEAIKIAKELEEKNKLVEANDVLTKADEAITRIEAVSNIQQQIINKPIKISTPNNIISRTLYDFEIIDKNKINKNFLIPDFVKIRKTVQAMKEDAESFVGGIKVIKKISVSNLRR